MKEIQERLDNFGKDADCYNCVHRRNVVYSAHSRCVVRTPDTDRDMELLTTWQNIFISVDVDGDNYTTRMIEAASHGIKNGWFNYPLNFDPVWLEKCTLFKPMETPNES